MNKLFRYISALLMLQVFFSLCSCSGLMRKTGFVPEKKPIGWYDFTTSYQLHDLPRVTLSTFCSDEMMLSFGPRFVIPLPVIPNPQYILDYIEIIKRPGELILQIEAPPDFLDWNCVTVTIILDGNILELGQMQDTSDVWRQHRMYIFRTYLTCKKLEDKQIVVKIDGFPDHFEGSSLFYRRKWQIWSEL